MIPKGIRNIYSVTIEGEQDEGSFFVMYDIRSTDEDEAVSMAKEEAAKDHIQTMNIESVTLKKRNTILKSSKILKRSGRSYFS